ncbi:hypothetical protein CY34DRAFT_811426 [Suillus luteus UH-Slu-Lm8-n1]|uniref:Uncharacterized protein n=1 Tax=Suillus luteus UH-Slu-Lm8-n1 TaxID=930992 RepID=A0A0D0A3H9_9AGAM|nr:hypothetical protein CY34DRAFT_811426 [Suillus luteus UH-Slu-Lm8-n1]
MQSAIAVYIDGITATTQSVGFVKRRRYIAAQNTSGLQVEETRGLLVNHPIAQ